MDLPYGLMSDEQIKALELPRLQGDSGLLFLWVTGRAMERGREVLEYWGYKQVRVVVACISEWSRGLDAWS
jgi:mRNA (2'-O-methyladenosine-N6-)-methyltransferase